MKIICIHRSLEEDLMFWDSLVARLAVAKEPCILMVGAGEREAGNMDFGAEMEFANTGARLVYEDAMRSRGKKIIQKISDAGISSSMVLGSDRRQIYESADGQIHADRLTLLLEMTVAGVLTVVMTSGRDALNEVIDVDPFRSGLCVYGIADEKDGIDKVHIILLVRKTSDAGRAADAGDDEISADIIDPGGQIGSMINTAPRGLTASIMVTTPGGLFARNAAALIT